MQRLQDCLLNRPWVRSACLSVALMATGLLTAVSVRAQAPANDNFADGTVLTGPAGTTSGSTLGATREVGEPYHYTTQGGHSVWHTWTADRDGAVVFDTRGSLFDTLLAAYTGDSVNALMRLANNDDSIYGLQSMIRFTAVANQTYHVAVDGYGGSMGLYTLNWAYTTGSTNPPVPPPALGEMEFDSSNYWVSATSPGYVLINVITEPSHTDPLTVQYTTSNLTAIAGVDYIARNGTLTFAPGESNQTFLVQILDNPALNTNREFLVTLFNPVGTNAALGPVSNTVVTVQGSVNASATRSGEFQFSASLYAVTEREYTYWWNAQGGPTDHRDVLGCLVTVNRVNGSTGRVLVDWQVQDAFFPQTGTLIFDDGQTSTNFVVDITLLSNQPGITNVGTNIVYIPFAVTPMILLNPRPAPEENAAVIMPSLGLQTNALVQVASVRVPGQFSIERLHYRVDEYRRQLIFTVVYNRYSDQDTAEHSVEVRVGQNFWYLLDDGSDYATPTSRSSPLQPFDSDFENQTVTLTFPDNDDVQQRRQATITINDDSLVEFNEDIHVYLWSADRPPTFRPVINPYARLAHVTILYDEQPPGALDREWNPDNVSYTTPPFNLAPGANGPVYSVAVQPDGKTVLGGDFTSVNTVPRNHVARLNANGSLDTGFLAAPNTGADGFISQVAVLPSGKILVAGGFTSFNGFLRNGIARLNADGSLDFSFDPGTGADGAVWAMAVQEDGRIVIGGEFFFINEVSRPHVARLNPNGSLDFSFDPQLGTDGPVWAVALERVASLPRIYLGGDFLNFNSTYRGHVARLDSGGSLDTAFFPGSGANGPVYALAVQGNGRLLVGGQFNDFDSRTRVNLARLNTDGSLDLTYDPGQGANNSVYSITLQTDDKAYIGGLFTSYNATRRMGMALLKTDGTLDTTFMDSAYNQFAGFCNPFSFQPPNFVNSIAIQPDGNLMVGGSFTNVGGNEPGQVVGTTTTYPPGIPVWTRQDKATRYNIARLLGTWGVTSTTVTTTNSTNIITQPNPSQGPGNIQFAFDNYSIDEFQPKIELTMNRIDGTLGTLTAQAGTTNRTAVADRNYVAQVAPQAFPEFYRFMRSDGFPGPVYFTLPILNDPNITGNLTVDLGLAQPVAQITLGGEIIPLGGALGRTTSLLTIVDDDVLHGTLAFNSEGYATNESDGSVTLSLVRTNGHVGSVSVDYYTVNGTALGSTILGAGDYLTKRGTITFPSGVTNASILIPITDNTSVNLDKNFTVILTNATGGAVLPGSAGGPPAFNPATNTTAATVTIIDDDFPAGRLNFLAATYTTNEGAGYAVVSVSRTGGSVGPLSVSVGVTNGSAPNAALAGRDFAPSTNLLSWVHGETLTKTILVPILDDNLVDGSNNVSLRLFNPSNGSALGSRTTAKLWILDDDGYGALAFSRRTYSMDENGTGLDLTVQRYGGIAGTCSVQFATFDGSGTALNNDYAPTNGVLVFAPGEISKTFRARPVDNGLEDGDRTFIVALSNPGGGAGLLAPSNAVLTIVDNESSVLPAGSVDVTFNIGTGPDRPVYALALQADRKLIVGGEFTTINNVIRRNLARLLEGGQLDNTFNVGAGANDQLRAIALQPDGRLLLGGFFTTFNGVNRSRLCRLYADGTLDYSFNPGAGADNPVHTLALQSDGRILVGGAFASYNGVTMPHLVRLNTNGSLHGAFSIGTGPNGPVFAIAVQPDSKIIIAGDFTAFNNLPHSRIARLNPNGSIDTSFTVGAGADAIVRTLAVQTDGRILVGGSFTNFEGHGYLVRLNPNGTLDTNFLAGLSGPNDSVFTLTLQDDEKILLGGTFTTFNGVTRNRITRLNQDGSVDASINFGEGANGFVAALVIQQDRKIVLGGGFTQMDARPANHLARVFGGSLGGPGSIEFSQPFNTANEADGVALLKVMRRGGTFGTAGANWITYDGMALDGEDYTGGTGTLTFPQGEVMTLVRIPLTDDRAVEFPESFYVGLDTPTGGADIGVVPVAVATILSDDSVITFGQPDYNVAENTPSGSAVVNLWRTGATNTTVTVNYQAAANPALPNAAVAGQNFVPVFGTLTFLPGQTNKVFLVPILNDGIATGNRPVQLRITGASPANTVNFGVTNALLTIFDAQFAPGVLSFSAATYTVSEHGANAVITVVRNDGASGIVSVKYATSDLTATVGIDYLAASGVLAFSDGETNKTFLVPVLPNPAVTPNRTVRLTLSEPGGGATLAPPTTAVLSIEDFESLPIHIGFAATNFVVNENDLAAVITVERTDNLLGTVSVDFASSDGSANGGLDYVGTNGTVSFGPDETVKTFTVPIIFDQLGEPSETVNLTLSNPSANVVLTPASALLTIVDTPLAGAVDDTFNSRWGADGTVYAAVFDTRENLYVAGDFQHLNGVAMNRVGRMTTNGTVDISFDSAGPNAAVYAVGRSTNGLVIGGAFTGLGTIPRGHVARLRFNGSVDPVFNSAVGADGDVRAVAVQLDDRVLIGGNFHTVGGQSFNYLARLFPDGAVDVNFRVGVGANGQVRTIALMGYASTGSSILIGGDFTRFDGVRRNRLARLNPDGTLDTTFATGLGPDGPVYSVAVLTDGRVVIAGNFTTVDGVPRNRVARLNADGTVDLSFDPGTGANSTVRAIDVQVDGRIVLAGDFTQFNGNTFNRLVRLDPSGTVDSTFNPGVGANQRIYGLALGSTGQPIPKQGPRMDPSAFWAAQPRIVGGVNANIADYPYQVALIYQPYNPNNIRPNQFCGGSILNDRWILTAAHCSVGQNPAGVAVAVGITDLTQPTGGQIFNVDRIVIHPNYNPGTGENDIALWHLMAPISFFGNYVASPVRPVTPAEANAGLTDPGVMTTITGWGTLSSGGAAPNILQVGACPITATSAYPIGVITPDMIMAGYAQGGIDTCQGDSGGPLVVTNAQGGLRLAGATSWGNGCALPNYPGVYARVSYFYDWIISQISEIPPGPGQSTSSKIAVVGEFTQFNRLPRKRIAVLETSGEHSATFDPAAQPANTVFALAVHTNSAQPSLLGKIMAAGEFTQIVGVDQQYRVARLNDDGTLDESYNVGLGPDRPVRSMAMQADGKVIIGGLFTNVNNVPRAWLARLDTDGSLDIDFNAGVGLNGAVYAIAIQPDQRVLVGGVFTTVYGVSRLGIARLKTDGTVDTTFNPGVGADGAVNAILVDGAGGVIIAGDFLHVDNQPRARIARLLPNGSVDAAFDPGAGFNGSVYALALTSGGRVLVGGSFTSYGVTSVGRLVRLHTSGALDTSFAPGFGADDFVSSIALQSDDKVLLGGAFVAFNGQLRNRLTRLNADGTLDATINFGTGADRTVNAVVVAPSTLHPQLSTLLIGGAFTQVNGQPRVAIARLLGGENLGGGSFQFNAPAFSVSEAGTNVALTVLRVGGTSGAASVQLKTSDGTAVSPLHYAGVSTYLSFGEAEMFKSFPIAVNNDSLVNGNRSFSANLQNATGAGLGAPASALVTILDNDGVIGFGQPIYTVTEGSLIARIQVVRAGGSIDRVSVGYAALVRTNDSAGAGDFNAVAGTLVFNPGVTVQSFDVPINDDNEIEQPETISLVLTNVTGPATLGRGVASLVIQDNDLGPGVLVFATNRFQAVEAEGQVVLSIQRTNGFSGSVSVSFFTTDGTAFGGLDYAATNGLLTFAEGETNKSIVIALANDLAVEGDETFTVTITNATGGGVIAGESVATVRVVDDDFSAGSLDRTFDPGLGANSLVRSLAADGQGRVVVGGAFTMFNGTNHNFVVRLGTNGALDNTFLPPVPVVVTNAVVTYITNGFVVTAITNYVTVTNLAGQGPNSYVSSVSLMSDGRAMIGGAFVTFNGSAVNRVARLLTNGLPDPNFLQVPGFNGVVNVVAVRTNARVLVGGNFTAPTLGVTQLRPNASVDTSFNPGSGANAPVHWVVVLPEGGAFLSGAFSQVAGTAAGRVVKLTPEGAVDPSFYASVITNGTVYALAVQADGHVLVGGDFVLSGRTNRQHLIRLNTDGSMDSTFRSGAGPNATVFALGLQSGGEIILGGDFVSYNGTNRNRLARLNSDGSLDLSFDVGAGPNSTVYTLSVLPSDAVLIGGDFTSVNGVPRRGVARIVGSVPPLRVTSIVTVAGGSATLTISSVAGVTYYLEASDDLSSWTVVDVQTATGPETTLVDPGAGSYTYRFYRVRSGAP
ncbi:MAG: trypsin-like serine protease [Verrucomicrobia bacterium]|nr:trypsin-like serine protease [Verrucomicrobiota bacterium]